MLSRSTGQSDDTAHGSRGIPLVAQAIPQIEGNCPFVFLGLVV